MKPYQVWWKRQDEWKLLKEFDSPSLAHEYANNNIAKGNITQRIELRDGGGVLETIWDSSWS